MQVPSGERPELGGTVEGTGKGTASQGLAGAGSSKESQDRGWRAQSWHGSPGSWGGQGPREAVGDLL